MVKELQQMEYEITEAKNSDYSWTELAFNNFDLVEKLWICSAEIWLLVRITDKISRIANLIHWKKIKVKDERIIDTLSDLANYSRILNIYIQTKEHDWKEIWEGTSEVQS